MRMEARGHPESRLGRLSAVPSAPWVLRISCTPSSAGYRQERSKGRLPGTPPCEMRPSTQAEDALAFILFFLLSQVHMFDHLSTITVHSCTHTQPSFLFLLLVCDTQMHAAHSPVHTRWMLLSASSVWPTLPLPPTLVLLHKALLKPIIFTPHGLDWPLLELLSL